ncbi:MAG: hypothetical protein IJ830_06155, partial [Alphaproteobacteria bacterium]|nr:hypothetical protein [Alphaproteobacteria bacterium]
QSCCGAKACPNNIYSSNTCNNTCSASQTCDNSSGNSDCPFLCKTTCANPSDCSSGNYSYHAGTAYSSLGYSGGNLPDHAYIPTASVSCTDVPQSTCQAGDRYSNSFSCMQGYKKSGTSCVAEDCSQYTSANGWLTQAPGDCYDITDTATCAGTTYNKYSYRCIGVQTCSNNQCICDHELHFSTTPCNEPWHHDLYAVGCWSCDCAGGMHDLETANTTCHSQNKKVIYSYWDGFKDSNGNDFVCAICGEAGTWTDCSRYTISQSTYNSTYNNSNYTCESCTSEGVTTYKCEKNQTDPCKGVTLYPSKNSCRLDGGCMNNCKQCGVDVQSSYTGWYCAN